MKKIRKDKKKDIVDNSFRATKSVKLSKKNNEVFDICTILKKCSIDEISKYILKEGSSKNFPDITKR